MQVVCLVSVVVAICLANDYGVSWDESLHSQYAEGVLRYLGTWGADDSCNDLYDLKYYTPAVDVVAASIYRWMPDYKYTIRHLVSALIAIATVPALFRIGKQLGNEWIGVASGVSLLLTPRFFGHAFVNSKDIPLATALAWAVWALLGYFDGRRRESVFWCVVTFGAVAMIRPAGTLFIAAMFVAALAYADMVQRKRWSAKASTYLHGFQILLGTWLLMVLVWPWAHENAIGHPLEAIRKASSFHTVVPVLFDGTVIKSNELPRSYLPKMLSITTPLPVLAFAVLGFAFMLREQVLRPRSERSGRYFIVQCWLLVPLFVYLVLRPNIYDGIRHFLFLLPAICFWCGIGFVLSWQAAQNFYARFALSTTAVVSLLSFAIMLCHLHPYQMTYFNGVAGGLAGAERKYETEYWLTSYREAMEWINEQVRREDPGQPVRVAVAANEQAISCASAFAGPKINIELLSSTGVPGTLPPGIRYYVGSYRYGLMHNYPASPIVHSIQRDGVTFAVVRENRHNSLARQ